MKMVQIGHFASSGKAMLPNGQDVRFLIQRGLARLNELNENGADWTFRNIA